MSQSIRYQVFVSSTFTDLKEERAEVLQAIWELDCIPTGMEAFVASNEAQWDVIKKVIDECDYYVLIIGGRYGSVTADGISYTEKEYNYAKSLGIPVLGFVHGNPENIPLSKTEKEEPGRLRLSAFRTRVMDEHPVRMWTNYQELGGQASRSISRAIKVNPRPGWIRNIGPSNLDLLEQINAITKENSALKAKISVEKNYPINLDDLENGYDKVTIEGFVTLKPKGSTTGGSSRKKWKAIASWDDIFRDVGPLLMNESTQELIEKAIVRYIGWSQDVDHKTHVESNHVITPECYAAIIVQFRALGLIDKGIRKRAVSDKASYWALTSKGENYLIGLLARKKGTEPTVEESA
ncbi:DUF4062 domain-containing protein [Mesorhizobium sp.]|uniref:DUF4062 domain-containing protein n=1 Tax=Mesorhizobium sp. TaxID=1871066 RepID=UPI0025C00540|nr:DUF4062 domain-containing protein [Mesorhizobium sp.]